MLLCVDIIVGLFLMHNSSSMYLNSLCNLLSYKRFDDGYTGMPFTGRGSPCYTGRVPLAVSHFLPSSIESSEKREPSPSYMGGYNATNTFIERIEQVTMYYLNYQLLISDAFSA